MKAQARKYSCQKCGGSIHKTPCAAPGHKGKNSKITYSGLHGWECDTCGKGIKVKVELA